MPRRSPRHGKQRRPWRPTPGAQVVERAGNREWFTDRLFVESKQANLPAACSTSAVVHGAVVILVLLLLAAKATRTDLPPSYMDVSLQMPAMFMLVPPAAVPPPARKPIERPAPAPGPPPAPLVAVSAAAPLDTPLSIEAEPATLHDASESAAIGAEADGAIDGVSGGIAGGTGVGPSGDAPSPDATGPFPVGDGIERPRKIKDVKPVYPLPAMSGKVGGSVVIEATIGADGKVHNARVLRSIPVLDQAALDAVRQWEYEPSRRHGVPVAVTMVILVTFALL